MNSNVTPINSLPDLEEFERRDYIAQQYSTDILPMEHTEKVQKFLRNNYKPPAESGMYQAQYNELANIPDNGIISNMNNMHNLEQNMFMKNYNMVPEIHCIDVSKHIENCPICSKFYNTDKSIYIIIIVFLAIVCVLLLKRVLDV